MNGKGKQEQYFMRKAPLAVKLLGAQLLTFMIIYVAVLTITPNLVYYLTNKGEVKTAMSFNEQIAMRIEQRFSELERFSSVVASDDGLNELLREAMTSNDYTYQALLHLYLSNIIQRDGVSTYHVLGMYLELDGEETFTTNTVGLSDNLKIYIKDKVLPEYEVYGNSEMFVDPFIYSMDSSQALFGNRFAQGYGYVRPYSKNGLTGRLVIISSYDEIVYIVNDLGDYCNDYLLLTGNYEVVPPSVEDSRIDYQEVLENVKYGDSYKEGWLIRKDGIYSMRQIGTEGWTIISYLSREEVLDKNRTQSYMILLSVGIFGVVVMAILVAIVNKLIKPLREVSKQMGVIANGNFKARVTIHSQDEIGKVGESFNIMAVRLEKMITEILQKEKLEQTMRYSLLISQMDPHFIYNTMNTITYLAQKGRNEDVIAVNKSMIEILRDRLRIEISEVYDTVEQEVNVVKQYLTIQKYRYDDMFKVKYDIDSEITKCLIIKNILQPLVENALAHGILENKDENGELLGGCVSIRIEKQGEFIKIEVADNGAGMSEERLQEVMTENTNWERGSHIGIRNVRERIRYIYQTQDCLSIWSKIGIGTKVTLKLPINVEEGKNGNIRVNNIV